uniref:UDP-N-acetylmuramoyl-tripeptide--D-alanyl-D-alanine ligase n=1 Tax=Desulfatirhabdium butyrativorans TaxID=340467 RepID=A0A7C4RRE8_9BACT
MNWSLQQLIDATQGFCSAVSEQERFTSIGTDSRSIEPGGVFVALIGEKHDGHRFADAAVDRGARALVLQRGVIRPEALDGWKQRGVSCILVSDTLKALGDLAAFHRRRMNALRVVAITGSNGKTSTKNLTAAVLRQQTSVLSTEGNFNNLIGVPLTLFRVDSDHRWAVIEMGMNRFGEIDRLGEIASPDISVITNVAPAHLEGLGSIEGVARAKAELIPHVRHTMVLNADDPLVRSMKGKVSCRCLFFGHDSQADVGAKDIETDPAGSRFRLMLPGNDGVWVRLQLSGKAMVANALAAAAVGYSAGMSPDAIVSGLESVAPTAGRMCCIDTPAGIRLIDDTYNANPGSMRAAFASLAPFCKDHRIFLVLGDMLELGSDSAMLHRRLGRAAFEGGFYRLLVCGRFAEETANGAVEAGMAPSCIRVGGKPELQEDLKERLRPGDWVFIKGSRGMAMESIVNELRSWAEGK